MHGPVTLRAAFKALPPVEYRRTLYRSVRLKFLSPTPLSGIGAKLVGARFTPKDPIAGFDTLYLAEDPNTAFAEFHYEPLALARDMDDDFAVRLAVTATVAPHAVLVPGEILDVTRREVRLALGTTLAELAAPWRVFPGLGLPPTQILGREAFNSGLFQAIRYPSVRNPGGVCLAVFVGRLAAGGPAFLDIDDYRNNGPVQYVP